MAGWAREWEGTHLEILVRGLLVLLGHGAWAALAECADGGEDGEGDGDAEGGVAEDLPALAWRREGTRAVGAEGDPVSCRHNGISTVSPPRGTSAMHSTAPSAQSGTDTEPTQLLHHLRRSSRARVRGRDSRLTSFLLLQRHLGPIGLHAVTQGHPQVGLLLRRQGLPSLLDVGEGRARDGVGGAAGGRSYDGGPGRGGEGAGRWGAKHFGWVVGGGRW